ncbi:MAG: malonyl-CoA decarboxylase family protein, partial [Gammaproteobacteria bacterium]|nr:malonyl-CoA decarboxylase family protein [Gammaproteobacteria bacterium]
DPLQADAAIFYSINNCQKGLRGISFGNFLIKQVVTELTGEFPGIARFATLSPLPRFREVLEGLDNPGNPIGRPSAEALLADQAAKLCQAGERESPVEALFVLLEAHDAEQRPMLGEALGRLALAYLARARRGDTVYDPVAGFHLANGARLERINPFADPTPERLSASYGVMVNYLYDPAEVERNHERFVNDGTVTVGKALQKELKRVDAALLAAESPRARAAGTHHG